MSARWELWMWACMYVGVYESATLSILFHGPFATVLVTAGGLVISDLSCFTMQAVVELLSLCGLSVVSGLLTQDLLVFFPSSVPCLKPTYIPAWTYKHKPACMHARHIWDVKTFVTVVSQLVLWNGAYQTLWRCRGISLAVQHSHWRKSLQDFHPSLFCFCVLRLQPLSACTSVGWSVGPLLWCGLKYLNKYWIDSYETLYRLFL